ncbi:hypothetical protein IW140_000599 [Coemansia sp. RSA 1813]|nr:hypothetical protein EV178_002670 [Coemansia sp. RSA 1646]KAJ1774068.1 hypothetical protein LPJ74_000167 [Coemansia sp. RSA 1843]KAJ2216764.1 hypothetical protein EV179_001054 [Coemansia sp. RSA 487]KAJ2572836.1 hypothetical protein IW140_000599 [Coemansia sp. RSA 1813]
MWQNSPSAYRERGAYENYTAAAPIDYDSFDEGAADEHTYGGIRQLEQTSANSARDMTSMMGTNPYTTLHYVNRELMELGLPSPLHLPEVTECHEDNRRVVDCLVELLKQRGKDLSFREQMEDELRKAMGEEDLLRSTIARLERDLDGAQREAAMNKIKWQEAERVGADVDAQRKKLAAELRTTKSNAAMVKAQFVHETKKHEQVDGKLKERLQKMIVDKHRSSKLSVDLVNPVARDRSGRPVDAAASRDRRLLEELIGRYEANESELAQKIDALEAMLRDLMAALAALHADIVSSSPSGGGNGSLGDELMTSMNGEAGDPAATMALIDAISQCVHQDRAHKPAPAADQSEIARRDQEIAQLRDDTSKLAREIEDQRQVMEEQKKVMDMMSAKEFANSKMEPMDVLEASFSEMSMEQLEMEREALRKEKQQLEDERKRFTDAAIELGNERSELKREREEFETRKVAQGTTDLLSGLPETPQWMRGVDTSQATPMILSQLQSMYNGTPTNAMLANMAAVGAAFSAAMGTPTNATPAAATAASQTRSPDDEFPEIASPAGDEMDDSAQQHRAASSRARALDVQSPSQTTERTPNTSRKVPVRTPADIRSSRQPRTCTRPGCAAHTPHTHEDGVAAPVMQLKPPVPRFRRRGPDANSNDSDAASALPSQTRQPSAASSSGSTRHAPYLRNPATSSSSSSLVGAGAARGLARSASSSGNPDQSAAGNSRRGTVASDIFR